MNNSIHELVHPTSSHFPLTRWDVEVVVTRIELWTSPLYSNTLATNSLQVTYIVRGVKHFIWKPAYTLSCKNVEIKHLTSIQHKNLSSGGNT